MDDDIFSVTLESVIRGAMEGSPNSLALLVEHPEGKKIIDDASAWAARKYGQDKDDLRQILLMKICTDIHTLEDPSAFRSWCYSVLRNYSLNKIERMNTENTILDKMRDRNRESKRKTPGGTSEAHSSSVLRPDQEFLLDEGLRRATKKFPQEIVNGWILGKKPREIAEETGKSVKTIYHILKMMLQTIIEEIGTAPGRKKPASKRARKPK